MTSQKVFDELLNTIAARKISENKHADADCKLVLGEEWLTEKERVPKFFYGIAHMLKHRNKKKAHEIDTLKQDPSKTASSEELCALARTVGWADEFFWLSVWAEKGTLQGAPDAAHMDDPLDLFFHALVHVEWGDLLREAWFFARRGLVDADYGGAQDAFDIWRPGSHASLADAFYQRAEKRFQTACRLLDKLDSLVSHQRKLEDVTRDIRRHLCLGRGRIQHAYGIPELALGELNYANALTDGRNKLIKVLLRACQLDARVDLDYLAMERKLEHAEEFKPIHILARWLEDLLEDRSGRPLQDKGCRPLHPRLALPKDEDLYNRNVTTFPNRTAIEHVKKLLRENLEWLRFAMADKGELREIVESVERRNRSLNKEVFTSSEHWTPCFPDEWRLFVLRDWGSFTPLLPDSLRRSLGNNRGAAGRPRVRATQGMGGGGGYFLQWQDRGIVIDPGYDYIPHFYEARLSPDMITDVIVTHDHYDHAASFGPLLNLLFKDRQEPESRGYHEAVSFYLSRGVFDQYARFIVDYKYFDKVEPLTDEDETRGRWHVLCNKPRLRLVPTHTEHADRNGFGIGVGLVFKFASESGLPTLGITSDTGWYDQWNGQGKKKAKSDDRETTLGGVFAGHKPAVMVLHVGSLRTDELVDSGFYRTHLGARGVFRTLDAVKSCRLALLSEFGEECQEWRVRLSEKYTEYFKSRGPEPFRCFPSDRRTLVVARGGRVFIGRNDDRVKGLLPYASVEVDEQDTSDGTFRFRAKKSAKRRRPTKKKK